MDVIKNLVVLYLTAILLGTGWSTSAMANMDREFIDVISSGDKNYLVASLFRDKKPVQRALLKFEDEFRGGDTSLQVAILKEYYEYMVQGEPKKAAKLFFAGDGSKERFINGLIDMPDRYAGYTNLERVDFLDSYGWGPFQIFEVRLSGSKVGAMQWREALLCNDQKCFLTNQIDTAESGVREFSEIRRLLNGTASAQNDLLEAFGEMENKAIFMPSDARDYANIQNKQYPMTFSFEMESIQPVSVDLSNETSPKNINVNGINVGFVADLFKELASLAPLVESEEIKNQTDTDPEKDQAIQAYNQVVDKFTTPDATRDIYLYSLFQDEDKTNRQFRREWYHPVAAIQRISRWTSIEIIGFIPQDDTRTAIFFQPTSKAQDGELRVEPIQGMAIENRESGPKLMLTNFRNNAQQTINFALEAPVLDVLGTKYAEQPTLIYNL